MAPWELQERPAMWLSMAEHSMAAEIETENRKNKSRGKRVAGQGR